MWIPDTRQRTLRKILLIPCLFPAAEIKNLPGRDAREVVWKGLVFATIPIIAQNT